MVLYILTGYWVLGIVSLDQLKGACHTHISYYDTGLGSRKSRDLPVDGKKLVIKQQIKKKNNLRSWGQKIF